jgi:peptide/nickel transport system permease protein
MSDDLKNKTPVREVEHYVDPEPFNPAVVEELSPEQERFYQASQWQIMWWKFKRHKLAVWSGVVLLIFYLCVPFCGDNSALCTGHAGQLSSLCPAAAGASVP